MCALVCNIDGMQCVELSPVGERLVDKVMPRFTAARPTPIRAPPLADRLLRDGLCAPTGPCPTLTHGWSVVLVCVCDGRAVNF